MINLDKVEDILVNNTNKTWSNIFTYVYSYRKY